MQFINIAENDNFVVEYDIETNTYRVSYFRDYHFCDEFYFSGVQDNFMNTFVPTCQHCANYESIDDKVGYCATLTAEGVVRCNQKQCPAFEKKN